MVQCSLLIKGVHLTYRSGWKSISRLPVLKDFLRYEKLNITLKQTSFCLSACRLSGRKREWGKKSQTKNQLMFNPPERWMWNRSMVHHWGMAISLQIYLAVAAALLEVTLSTPRRGTTQINRFFPATLGSHGSLGQGWGVPWRALTDFRRWHQQSVFPQIWIDVMILLCFLAGSSSSSSQVISFSMHWVGVIQLLAFIILYNMTRRTVAVGSCTTSATFR